MKIKALTLATITIAGTIAGFVAPASAQIAEVRRCGPYHCSSHWVGAPGLSQWEINRQHRELAYRNNREHREETYRSNRRHRHDDY